jgi:hypothetical protein
MPITDRDVEDYLRTRSDFDLELFIHRTLREHGCPAIHGGTYIDPIAQKARQFDIRATWEIYKGHETLPACRLPFGYRVQEPFIRRATSCIASAAPIGGYLS